MSTLFTALPLLDYLAWQAGCEYLSDLPRADGCRRAQLLRALQRLPAEAAGLREWNDALDYLVQAPPAETPDQARLRLIAWLSRG